MTEEEGGGRRQEEEERLTFLLCELVQQTRLPYSHVTWRETGSKNARSEVRGKSHRQLHDPDQRGSRSRIQFHQTGYKFSSNQSWRPDVMRAAAAASVI